MVAPLYQALIVPQRPYLYRQRPAHPMPHWLSPVSNADAEITRNFWWLKGAKLGQGPIIYQVYIPKNGSQGAIFDEFIVAVNLMK